MCSLRQRLAPDRKVCTREREMKKISVDLPVTGFETNQKGKSQVNSPVASTQLFHGESYAWLRSRQ